MRASCAMPESFPTVSVSDPLSQVTNELVEDLKKLQGMGLDLSELLKEAPGRSKAEQARVNGAKSKGPVTAAGKASSSQNALKHGLCAKGVLLPDEDPADFESFTNDFCQELSPQGTLQKTLVQRAAELSWKLRRLPAVEGAILESARVRQEREDDEHGAGGIGDLLHQLIGRQDDGILMRLQRYETRLERSLQGCLRELRLVKKDRAGLFGTNAVGSFGVFAGRALPAEESLEQTTGPACHGLSGGQCPPYQSAVGSFGTGSVGSFGIGGTSRATGAREEAFACEVASPARGPSATRQDDGFAGVPLGVGSFRAGTVGSFRTVVAGPFGAVGLSWRQTLKSLASSRVTNKGAAFNAARGGLETGVASELGSFGTGQ